MTVLNPLLGRRAVLQRLGYALGGIATAPLASGLLAGCRTPADDALASYTFQTLDADQQNVLAALVDQILPATDTPGASDVGVPQFIDTMLSEWYAPEERDRFLAGLGRVDARADGGSFAALAPDDRAALVAVLDAETFGGATAPETLDDDVAAVATEGTAAVQEEAENEVAGLQGDLGDAMTSGDDTTGGGTTQLNTGEGTVTVGDQEGPPFFRQLKELTLAGYYTSEAGATQELQWLAAPGRYDADVPLAEVGRAWA